MINHMLISAIVIKVVDMDISMTLMELKNVNVIEKNVKNVLKKV